MKRQELAFRWLKENQELLRGMGGIKIHRLFEKQHPGLYSQGGFRGLIDDIRHGRLTEQSFTDPEPNPIVKPGDPRVSALFPESKPVEVVNEDEPLPNFDKSFFENNMIEFPDSWAESFVPFDITGVTKLGICSDIHLPYHDPLALSACFTEFKRRGVDGIYLNGDVMDFEKISRFGKIPDGKYLKDEVEVGRSFIKSIRRMFPRIPIFWKDGNHEKRLQSYINEKCPELANLYGMDTPTMMGLNDEDVKVQYVPENIVSRFGKLWIAHGHELGMGGGSVNIARQVSLRVMVNILVGHWHKDQQYKSRNLADEVHGAWSLGCLCYLKPRYTGALNQWNQSAAVAELTGSGGEFRVNTFQIIDGRVV